MLETVFWILVGAFIGWNFPQPGFAKSLQEKYLQKYIDKVKAFLPFFRQEIIMEFVMLSLVSVVIIVYLLYKKGVTKE